MNLLLLLDELHEIDPFSGFLMIIIFVLGFIIYDKNQLIYRLKKDIAELKKQFNSDKIIENIETKNNQPQSSELESTTFQHATEKYIFEQQKNVASKEFDKTCDNLNSIRIEKNQNKNTAILALGAFFIVIAAISFLYSTWYTVPDFLKTCVILVLAGVFLGISKVAENVFKLTKTASTFFYIAMAYIPICLISISAFGFIGNYLSLSGEGKFIYLSLMSLLVTAIYLIFAYKTNDKKLYFASKFMQLLFVTFLACNFFYRLINVLCIILAYTIILNIMNNKYEKNFFEQGQVINKILVYSISIISGLVAILSFDNTLANIFLILGTMINSIIEYVKTKKEVFFGIAYTLVFALLYKILSLFNVTVIVHQIAVLAVIFLTTFIYNIKNTDKIIKKIINYTNIIFMFVLYIVTLFDNSGIDLFVLACIGNFIAFIVYFKSNKEQYELFCISTIISSIFLLLPDARYVNTMSIVTSYDVSLTNYLVCAISAIVMYIILYKDKNIGLKLIPIAVSFVNLYRYKLVIAKSFDLTFYINIVLVMYFAYLAIRDRKDIIYRASSFCFLIGLFIYAQLDLYLATLITIIWALIQTIFSENEIKNIMKGIIITALSLMYVVMFFEARFENITTKSYALSIVSSLICWYAFSKTKYIKALPMLGLMIPLFNYDLALRQQYDITFIVSLGIVSLFTYISVIGKKENVYKLISFVYLLALVMKYNEFNLYIKHIIIIIWGICQFLNSGEKVKDVIKVLISTCLLSVYINALIDLEIIEITAFNLLGFLVYSHVITRLIVKKYTESYKIFEYVATIVIYMYSFTLFNDVIDLVIFITMQVIILMLAYTRKLGPVFVVTLVSLVINTFYITQNFWLSIPWWVYLIVVGGTLIIFAARNELSEKQDINTIKEKLNKVRNYLDM